jgi:glyoxylase-like metal-dependent hydrolase (beta-lactamase superfamily II)
MSSTCLRYRRRPVMTWSMSSKGGESLPDCGGIHVIHTPRHTAGHISLHLPRLKTMIARDAIVSAAEHLMVSPTYLSSDPEAAHESVKRLIQMNLDLERLLVVLWS